MPDHRHTQFAALLALAAALLLLVALPSASFAASARDPQTGTVTIADVPDQGGEDCVDDPNAVPGVGLRVCPTVFEIKSLLPFVAAGVVVLLAIAVGWFLVMRRRASKPFLPDEAFAAASAGGTAGAGSAAASAVASGEWWTCSSCGSTNMVGTARCYKCGSLR